MSLDNAERLEEEREEGLTDSRLDEIFSRVKSDWEKFRERKGRTNDFSCMRSLQDDR